MERGPRHARSLRRRACGAQPGNQIASRTARCTFRNAVDSITYVRDSSTAFRLASRATSSSYGRSSGSEATKVLHFSTLSFKFWTLPSGPGRMQSAKSARCECAHVGPIVHQDAMQGKPCRPTGKCEQQWCQARCTQARQEKSHTIKPLYFVHASGVGRTAGRMSVASPCCNCWNTLSTAGRISAKTLSVVSAGVVASPLILLPQNDISTVRFVDLLTLIIPPKLDIRLVGENAAL